MNNNEFNTVLTERIEKIKAVLASKAIEYSSETDRLHNFKLATRLGHKIETPEQSLWGMAKKHLVSVIDIIDRAEKGLTIPDAMRDEKIGDFINYLILLEALLIERNK